jgi:predicted nucleic acid-binding protein
MSDSLVVPDASVLLKWVLRSDDEGDRDRALDLKAAWLAGSCQIVVPTLWAFEVGNVLGLKQARTADALLRALMDLQMPEVAPASYTTQIFRLMLDHNVTCYDAAYHALAVLRGGTMLTADRRYVRKAARAGHLRLLEDWSPPSVTTPDGNAEHG